MSLKTVGECIAVLDEHKDRYKLEMSELRRKKKETSTRFRTARAALGALALAREDILRRAR